MTQARGEAEAPCALAVATAKVALAICLTYVPKAREKGWRNRVHVTVGVLCTVGGVNAVKAPSSLKVKATDTAPHLSDDKSISVALKIYLGGLFSALISCLVRGLGDSAHGTGIPPP